MKNSTTVKSLVFGVFLFLTVSSPYTFAQTSNSNQQTIRESEFPAAQVMVVSNEKVTEYSFNIIHEIPEWKAERLEERLLLRYEGIQNIEIDAVENFVVVSVLNSADENTITKILTHFKFNGYEEL